MKATISQIKIVLQDFENQVGNVLGSKLLKIKNEIKRLERQDKLKRILDKN